MLPADHAVQRHAQGREHRRFAAQPQRRDPVARVLRAADEGGRSGRLGEARRVEISPGEANERLDRRGRDQGRGDGDAPASLAEHLGGVAAVARPRRLVEAGERHRAIEAVMIVGVEGAPRTCSASTLAPP